MSKNSFAILLVVVLIGLSSCFWHGRFSSDEECKCYSPSIGKNDCCQVESIEDYNRNYFHPIVNDIVQTDYFRYYKVNLLCGCRFWDEEFLCSIRNCAVDICTEDELPAAFKKNLPKKEEVVCATGPLSGLDNIDRNISLTDFTNLKKTDFEYMNNSLSFCDTGDDQPAAEYVDLVLNPERFTGYSGKAANNIWYNIYEYNAFKDKNMNGEDKDYPIEYKVFQRIISGLHASVNLHLVSIYPKSFEDGWDFNYDLFKKRFYPEYTNNQGGIWLQNIYYLYNLMIRAIYKARPVWNKLEFYTGNKINDNKTRSLISELDQVLKNVPSMFDENVMFSQSKEKNEELKEEIRSNFLNITRIMDCVGCEKCRLWGKLQTQGIGTALKILFTEDNLILSRNEIVSLFNAAFRYSNSIDFLHHYFPLMDLKSSKDEL